jgi:ribosomal protein S18 acetylase RimI-like enzyme
MSRQRWSIRNATQADAASVLDLWRQVESAPAETDSERALRALLLRDPESLLLAEVDGVLIATLIVGWDGWRGSFYRLAVDPSRRREGIAMALIRAGEERLRALGALRLTAIVNGEDGVARKFWEKAGYQRHAEARRFVRMLTEPRPAPPQSEPRASPR